MLAGCSGAWLRRASAAACEAVDGAQLVTDRCADGEYARLEQIVLAAVHELDSVPALHLGRVERLVGELDGTAGTAQSSRYDRGDPDADGHSREGARFAVLDVQLADSRPYAFGDFLGLLAVHVVENRRELLAP